MSERAFLSTFGPWLISGLLVDMLLFPKDLYIGVEFN